MSQLYGSMPSHTVAARKGNDGGRRMGLLPDQHSSLVALDHGGGSQVNPLIDMLLLQTFTVFKSELYRPEIKQRLPKTLTTILKPKTIEQCPGLNKYATELLIYIKENCLHYMA